MMITALRKQIRKWTDRRSSLEKAIDWVKEHQIPGSGIVVHHKTKDVTPEVTGYLITSLYNAGEKDYAKELAKWEMSVQQPDGSFFAPDKISYTFDTAQVVRGFLTVLDDMPEVESCIRRACDFILTQIDEKGEMHTPSYNSWSLAEGRELSRYCNLFCLEPLMEAGKRLKEQKYIDGAQKSLAYYKSKDDLTEFKPDLGTLSHIFGYMMEALADLGETELAKKGLKNAESAQLPDGAIPAYPGVDWICSTGLAQLGLAWYKVGNKEKAKQMLEYLESMQNDSGGFYGGYGEGVEYFPEREICWANKFFIDLYLLVRGK